MKNKKEIIYDLLEGKLLVLDDKLMSYGNTVDNIINELKTIYKDKNIEVKGTIAALNLFKNYKEVLEVIVWLDEGNQYIRLL